MATATRQRVPPLAAGDHLDRAEFLRRWRANPTIKYAELIGGIVYMPSPVSPEHGDMDCAVAAWLGHYWPVTPGIRSGANTTTSLLRDAPQPDLNLRILPEYGGGSTAESECLTGVPELLIEICRSSAAYDLHEKLELYEEAKVPEYLAILLYEQEVRWHLLLKGKYQLLKPDADDLLWSRVFPGLWLDPKALLIGGMTTVLARLRDGMQSVEYRQLLAKLTSRKSARKERKGRKNGNGS